MNLSVRGLLLALISLAFGVLASCSGPENQIVGNWKATGSSSAGVWEFSSNKAVDMAGRKGKYTFGDQGRLKVQTQFATFVYRVELSADRLVLTEPNGTRLEFERVK